MGNYQESHPELVCNDHACRKLPFIPTPPGILTVRKPECAEQGELRRPKFSEETLQSAVLLECSMRHTPHSCEIDAPLTDKHLNLKPVFT